jgi:patched 1 protein
VERAKAANWSIQGAQDLLDAWQRNFTKLVYTYGNHTWTDPNDGTITLDDPNQPRQFFPLATTSVTDLIAQFSSFNWGLIAADYAILFVYAGASVMVIVWLRGCPAPAVNSYSWLALMGILLISISSVSGFGLATLFGINFNAATTQVVPFLAVGLGVDEMIVMVHNYGEVVQMCRGRDEVAFLLKEVGLSVLLTLCPTMLAFFVGALMPIPAMRSFCLQVRGQMLRTAHVICADGTRAARQHLCDNHPVSGVDVSRSGATTLLSHGLVLLFPE